MMKKKIFISYNYDLDKHYKNLLIAWDKNREFDFSFCDTSIDVSVDSTHVAAINRIISGRIANSSYFLCFVGKRAHKCSWIACEMKKAVELEKKIIAVKISQDKQTPINLCGVGAGRAQSFNFDFIKSAISRS